MEPPSNFFSTQFLFQKIQTFVRKKLTAELVRSRIIQNLTIIASLTHTATHYFYSALQCTPQRIVFTLRALFCPRKSRPIILGFQNGALFNFCLIALPPVPIPPINYNPHILAALDLLSQSTGLCLLLKHQQRCELDLFFNGF